MCYYYNVIQKKKNHIFFCIFTLSRDALCDLTLLCDSLGEFHPGHVSSLLQCWHVWTEKHIYTYRHFSVSRSLNSHVSGLSAERESKCTQFLPFFTRQNFPVFFLLHMSVNHLDGCWCTVFLIQPKHTETHKNVFLRWWIMTTQQIIQVDLLS